MERHLAIYRSRFLLLSGSLFSFVIGNGDSNNVAQFFLETHFWLKFYLITIKALHFYN